MNVEENGADASHGGRPPALVPRLWGWMVDGMSAFGTALIVVLMGIICSDVVSRNLFGSSLPVIAEISALTLVMIVYLQLAAAVRHNRLARADLLMAGLQNRMPLAAGLLEAVFQLVGAVMLALVAWSTLGILESDLDRGQYVGVTGVLTVPTWPFRVVILFGMAVAVVEFVVQIPRRLAATGAGDGTGL